MPSINTPAHDIFFDNEGISVLNKRLAEGNFSKVFVLVDSNTQIHCLPLFEIFCTQEIDAVITIPPGEEHKNIATCTTVWEQLSELDGDRKSILINLGGGVVTDLGGFVASTFKRGITFINIPTTLLSMVDASVGGKTGVDLGALKNQVGVIEQPEMVLISPSFLNSLEERQLRSGFAEMLKHGLIKDANYWRALFGLAEIPIAADFIQTSIAIKGAIVAKDPFENGVRKLLNFGHTLGHAIESYFLTSTDRETLLHGEAIAVGMVLEGYISHKINGLPKKELEEIKNAFARFFSAVPFNESDISSIMALLKHDKKNTHGNVNFVLLKNIGEAVFDIRVPSPIVRESFLYYMDA